MKQIIVKTLALGGLLAFGFSNAQNKPKVVLDNFFNNEKEKIKKPKHWNLGIIPGMILQMAGFLCWARSSKNKAQKSVL